MHDGGKVGDLPAPRLVFLDDRLDFPILRRRRFWYSTALAPPPKMLQLSERGGGDFGNLCRLFRSSHGCRSGGF
jgi:hypothetical protein